MKTIGILLWAALISFPADLLQAQTDFGTNLSLSPAGLANGYWQGFSLNTLADVPYEIQSRTNLAQTDWQSEGFIFGSELTNWTPASVPLNGRPALYLRLRSWQDSYGIGIPDWWQLDYFGTNGIDPNASAAGDGFSNLQKFQMGLNPTNYYNTNPPAEFFGCLDASGTNILIEWSPSPGPVDHYVIQRGVYSSWLGNATYNYSQIGTASSNAVYFEDTGVLTNADAQNNIYNLWAVYSDGSTSGTNSWTVSWYLNYGLYGPPNGPPPPNDVYAYAVPGGTNVTLYWTPARGTPTNYLILRGVATSGNYAYAQIAALDTNAVTFQDVGVLSNAANWNNNYEVQTVFPGGGLSLPVVVAISTNPPPPTKLFGQLDATGTNLVLTWAAPPPGFAPTNYVIERGIYNTNTGNYDYAQIGQVSAGTTSFVDVGSVTDYNSYYDIYEVQAVYAGNVASPFAYPYYLPSAGPLFYFNRSPTASLPFSAQLMRGTDEKWQVAFSQVPTGIQGFNLLWKDYDYPGDDNVSEVIESDYVPVSSLTNGFYTLPAAVFGWITDPYVIGGAEATHLYVQAIGTDDYYGMTVDAGLIFADAPYFVDGRQYLKQNLWFKLRAATISQPVPVTDSTLNSDYLGILNGEIWLDPGYPIPADANYVESSFYHWAYQFKWYGNPEPSFVKMSGLWPFVENYELHGLLYDPAHPDVPPSALNDTNDFLTAPAPAVLGIGDPYWISQPLTVTSSPGVNPDTGLPGSATPASLSSDLPAYTNGDSLYMQSGYANLFGLPFQDALVGTNGNGALFTISPGGGIALTNVNCFYFQTPDPGLAAQGYYFGVVNTPGASLAGDVSTDQNQPNPLPCLTGFASTNQTGVMVASVFSPTVVGGWAKYVLQNGYANKYAYLGQYFASAALLDANGNATATNAGVLSPYGEFFPTAPGVAALVTMPDIDPPYQQGTGIVRVVSLNVDANHDGTMDFTYLGPDYVDTGKPFRFWVNDNQDIGDDAGNFGIPGLTYPSGDGWNRLDLYGHNTYDANGQPVYYIHGRRDLIDFFPVCVNLGSLFQNLPASAGIDPNDSSYQFILSQADGTLRFTTTDLTPTNYLNYLQDTNEASVLANAPLTTITASGVNLSPSFIAGIATNNQSIILVEAASATTNPLVLTIYHGTNQLAKTSLALSITGVEQMFRHKNLLLNPNLAVKPDRLADEDVPNEPDTNDKNFIFVHGYNVNPTQARGWDADIYKRLYWSGSHAKFYGVTWEGSDSQYFGTVTVSLQTNIVNAFNTAPLLNNFLNSLSGVNVVAAHSLGNMVVLSTLNDYQNQAISTYFMIDAAVPLEAIQGNATPDANMYYPDWIPYADKLNASHWWQLWPTNDVRNTLTWSNRLENLQNANVYNFYSSGEEVLREYSNTNGAPPGQLLAALDQVGYFIENETFNIGKPAGTYTWAWQELLKGRATYEGLFSSTHGGWKFNASYYSNGVPIPDSQAILLPNSELQTNAFFDVTSSAFGNADLALYGTSGSSYAQANRNRILADSIPCLTLPVGANPIGEFPPDHNFDMNAATFKNGWPSGRTLDNGNWHHSDCRQVAYTFTHSLFNNIVTLGELK